MLFKVDNVYSNIVSSLPNYNRGKSDICPHMAALLRVDLEKVKENKENRHQYEIC